MGYYLLIITVILSIFFPFLGLGLLVGIAVFLVVFYFITLRLRDEKYTENQKSFWPRVVLNIILKLQGVKLVVKGREHIPQQGNYVVIANHQSNYDILSLVVAFKDEPIGFVAKKSLGIPWLKEWMKTLGCVFIDRSDARQTMTVLLKEAAPKVANGKPMVLFPEGTRSQASVMNDFNAGGLVIAKKPKAMILPVTIDGTYKIHKNFLPKRIKVFITIHEGIPFSEYSGETNYQVVSENLAKIIRGSINVN